MESHDKMWHPFSTTIAEAQGLPKLTEAKVNARCRLLTYNKLRAVGKQQTSATLRTPRSALLQKLGSHNVSTSTAGLRNLLISVGWIPQLTHRLSKAVVWAVLPTPLLPSD